MIDARENGNVDTPCFQFRPSMKYHERMTTTDSTVGMTLLDAVVSLHSKTNELEYNLESDEYLIVHRDVPILVHRRAIENTVP